MIEVRFLSRSPNEGEVNIPVLNGDQKEGLIAQPVRAHA